MKLEDQVCSLELAKRLKYLGVKQESFFFWTEIEGKKFLNSAHGYTCQVSKEFKGRISKENDTSAFTVAELGDMLPTNIPDCPVTGKDYGCLKMLKAQEGFILGYNKSTSITASKEVFIPMATDLKETDARAKMLIHLIEKGIVKP